jgi:hypothetical protein
MPILVKNYAAPLPPIDVNLVVESITVDPPTPAVGQSTRIYVTLRNLGTSAITDDFWVDLYVDPVTTPSINVLWNEIAPFGKAWVVRDDIAGGATLVIHSDQPDDPLNPDDVYSNWPGWFVSAGEHTLYAQVDSYGLDYGLILEDDEADNVTGPQRVTVDSSGVLLAPLPEIEWQERR